MRIARRSGDAVGCLIFACMAIAGRASAACIPAPAGMTGWWTGDGSAADIEAGRDGFFRGVASTGSGFVGEAFVLNGNGDWIEVAHDPALNPGDGDFTVDLWVNFNTTAGEQVMVEKWVQYSSAGYGWTFTKTAAQEVVFALSGDFLTDDVRTQPGQNIPVNTWIHFAARRLASVCTIFMNGVPLISKTLPQNVDSPVTLKFGHRGNPDDTPGSNDTRQFYLNGRIDEVELFVGRGLSDAEILGLYSAGSDGKCKCTAANHAVTGIAMASGGSISWDLAIGGTTYDVVKGDLGALRSTGGSFSASLLTCLADDWPATSIVDSANPAAASGYWYLARYTDQCGGDSTYDGDDSEQSASRDPGIASSPQSCP